MSTAHTLSDAREKKKQKQIQQKNRESREIRKQIRNQKGSEADTGRKKDSLLSLVLQSFSANRKLPVSVQDTIRYQKLYRNGMMKVDDTHYNRMIRFNDINYQLAHPEEKEYMLEAYHRFLNHFDSSVRIQMTLVNEQIDVQKEADRIDIPMRNDVHDVYRQEYRDYLREQLSKGNNGLRRMKYLTFTIEEKNEMLASSKLARVEADIITNFRFMDVKAYPVYGKERIRIMHKLLNHTGQQPDLSEIDWEKTKDRISPAWFDFRKKDMVRINGKVSPVQTDITQAAFLHLIISGSRMDDRFLNELMDISSELVLTVDYEPNDQQKALTFVRRRLAAIEGMRSEVQKKALEEGYDMDNVPSGITGSLAGARKLLEDLETRNERYFWTSVYLTLFTKKQSELQSLILQAQSIAQKRNCELKIYDYAGEEAVNCFLPIGVNSLYPRRGLTTASLAIMIPFITQELFVPNGIYYGLNALTNNVIMADRKKLQNPNGLILGVPGSGKSFAAKREITNVLLTTEDDILISDPEAEYGALVKAWGGQEIILSTHSSTYINPLDINRNYSEDDNPIATKAEQVDAMMELILGSRDGITPIEKSILDRCVTGIYQKWILNPVPENIPILEDLFLALKKDENPAAGNLADALEIYVHGSLRYFNHRTNVEISNRLVSFNIKDLGKSLKKFAMLVIEDQIWNRVSANRDISGKYTWIYLDELHLLLKDEYTAAFTIEIWKRFRKWSGIPTGITQNAVEFISKIDTVNIFQDTSFYYLLSQGADDRQLLAEKLNLSEAQVSYIKNADEGEGILKYSDLILPFKDHFPTDTKLYELMNTSPLYRKAEGQNE